MDDITVVADVVARFRGDFSDLNQGADASVSHIQGLHDSASGLKQHFSGSGSAGEGADEMTQSFGAGGAVLDEMGKKAEGAGLAIRGMVTGAIGAAGLGGLLDMAKNTTMEIQTLGVQFNAAFGGSGSSELKSAIGFANQFGVSIAAAGTAYQQFGLSTKGTNQNMQQDMKAFADIAAGTGQSVDAVASSIGNYYQLVQRLGGAGGQSSRYATTLLTSHDINQETYNQLRLAANQGANPQDLLNMILSNGEATYAGAGKAQASTLSGQLQTFKNQFSEGTSGALAPVMGGLQSGLGDVNKAMDSQSFKNDTKDVAGFISTIGQGVALLQPFAKAVLDIGSGVTEMVSKFGFLKPVLEGVVAAFVAFKVLNIAADMLGISSATGIETASTIAQGNAVRTMTGTEAEFYAGSGLSTGRAASVGNSLLGNAGMIGGTALAIGSQYVGNKVGGSTGQTISDVGAGAGIGTMIEPGIGTVVGAAAGALVNAFQSSSEAAAAFSAQVKDSTAGWEKSNPVGTTAHQIQTHYEATKTFSDQLKATAHGDANDIRSGASGGIFGQRSQADANTANKDSQMANAVSKQADAAEANKNATMALIEKITGKSATGAQTVATSNDINLSAPLSANINALETVTENLHNLGNAAQNSAESVSNMFTTIGNQLGGAYGEQNESVSGLLKQYGTSFTQYQSLVGQTGGVMPSVPASSTDSPTSTGTPLTAGQASQSTITPQYAQTLNANLSATQQLRDAQFGLVQAQQQVTQAEWGEQQAAFGLSQANFALLESEFQLGRAILQNQVAQITQASATAATTTALSAGYLPANAQVAAQLVQVTSLTASQVSAIQTEVSAYNALEAQMYTVNSSGQSLWSTYTQLTGAVQALQAQTQAYQNVLNEPLQGTQQFSQAQEQYKVQEAAVQQQIDQLELQRVPTDDPRIKTLQAQLALLQSQADLSTQINTQGVGQQQFNIAQAQLGPSQSYQTQLSAAQGLGGLAPALLAAQQAAAAVTPQYLALNTALQVQGQLNSAVTGALSSQASADQGVITQNNAVVQAANGVTTAQNGVLQAQRAVTTAAWGLQAALNQSVDAQTSLAEAVNTKDSQILTNVQQSMSQVSQYITNVGVTAAPVFQGIAQQITFMSGYVTNEMQGNMQVAAAFMSLIGQASGKMLSTATIDSTLLGVNVNPNTLLPQAATGGTVTGEGAANVHTGEIILPAAIVQQIAQYGGDALQQKVGGALVNGIETGGLVDIQGGGTGTIGELAGGIGPAAGLFQFEPGTWLGNGGGQFQPTTPQGWSGAHNATWQQQVQVFVWATKGDNFGDWGPDLGYPGYGQKGGPLPGSPVARNQYATGGFVPGAGTMDATLHGGEFVLSNAMLAQLNGSGVAGGRGGTTITLGQGAVQVEIVVSGSNVSASAVLQQEVTQAIEEAFTQLNNKLNGN